MFGKRYEGGREGGGQRTIYNIPLPLLSSLLFSSPFHDAKRTNTGFQSVFGEKEERVYFRNLYRKGLRIRIGKAGMGEREIISLVRKKEGKRRKKSSKGIPPVRPVGK